MNVEPTAYPRALPSSVPPLIRGRRSRAPAAAVLLVISAILVARITEGFDIPALHCSFLEFTGWPCPYCGGTRSLRALGEGRVVEAFFWNPLVLCGALSVAVCFLLSILGHATVVERLWRWIEARILWLLIGFTLANWTFLLMKATGGG